MQKQTAKATEPTANQIASRRLTNVFRCIPTQLSVQ